ncbi:hypothetical protein [Halorubellus sp. JP-L1]|uniref:hypothetical protein n=1 Tax=Halorubellus sp. JP-L1 TaxID=2715753 RepID=UPI001877DC39|nr:hypothetical protein [Halorubellus sp. JP-L1]
MATLERGFEDDLREAVMDDVEATLVGEEANLVYEFVELVHARLRSYGERHGYDVESTIDSLGQPEVDRSEGRIEVTIGWESEQMARWEFGTSDHTVEGDPLSFVWHDPPQWVREEFDQARGGGGQFESGYRVFLQETEPSGIEESRAIRDALNGLRRVMQA